MRVTNLELTDYRNYANVEVEFTSGPNLIIGRNGQGKTNLVESIGFLSTLGSHRVSSDQPLIRSGRDAAVIRARLAHGERSILAEVQINRGAPNRAQINRSAVKPRELPRYCHSVLFAPEDLAIVRGEPAVRRRFLDELLIQRMPRFVGVLADYDRVLRQRNSLLKSARSSGVQHGKLSTLEIWDERLIEFGSQIIDARNDLVDELGDPMGEAYRWIVDADHGPRIAPVLSIDENDPDGPPSIDTPPTPSSTMADERSRATTIERFRSALASTRRKELERGVTLVGPHRDDVFLELNGLPAKGYASHGESWSFALSLILASAELLRRDSQVGDPIIVLDDVFAELDQRRRERLASAIARFEQVLITAAVPEDVPDSLGGSVFRVAGGEILHEAADE